jgi:hypothetical protein
MNNRESWWTLPPAELAAVILPWFGSRTSEIEQPAMKNIVGWLKTGSDPGITGIEGAEKIFNSADLRAVAEAMQVLERACLLMRHAGSKWTNVGLTRLGQQALETNTVRQHLGLSDATPMA